MSYDMSMRRMFDNWNSVTKQEITMACKNIIFFNSLVNVIHVWIIL